MAFAALATTGCGYSHQPLYPKEFHTVAAPIFKNRTFYQGAEFDLTEAVTKAIESRTPYKIAAEGSADTILTGTIVAIDQTQLSRVAHVGLPQEMELRMVVNLEWKNARTGRIIRDRQGLEAVGRYVPSEPVGESYQIGQHEAAQNLANAIVLMMQADW